MLRKSFEVMLVMMCDLTASGKRYGPTHWLIAGAVTGGVAVSLMTGPTSSSDDSRSVDGIMFLAGLLVLDGITSTFLVKLFKEPLTSKYDQLLYINLGSCIFSWFMLIASGRIAPAMDVALNSAPLWKYVAVSTSNVYAGTCQYEALKCITSPVQMLGKSFEVMLVMMCDLTVSGKRYGPTDWLIAGAVTGGVTVSLMTGPTSSSDDSRSVDGIMLLAGLLVLDGITSTFLEKLIKEPLTPKYDQMLYINLGSFIFPSFMMIASGRIACAMGFALNSAPLWNYVAVSTSNVYAGTCQYEAIKCIAPPVQMLEKSVEVMLVMMCDLTVSGKP